MKAQSSWLLQALEQGGVGTAVSLFQGRWAQAQGTRLTAAMRALLPSTPEATTPFSPSLHTDVGRS